MKILFIIFFLSGLFIDCNRPSKNANLTNDSDVPDVNFPKKQLDIKLADLLNKYDSGKVLIGGYFICRSEKISFFEKKPLLFCNLEKELFGDKYLKAILELNSILINHPSFGDKINVWCENENILNTVINSNLNTEKQIYFEEILSNIPITKNIMQKYIKTKDQYWGSLDVEQSCELYFDVLNHLSTLGEKERIAFFQQYYSVTFRLLSK